MLYGKESEVWCFHQSSNMTSVETKRRHEFSNNSDVLQLKKMDPFFRISVPDSVRIRLVCLYLRKNYCIPMKYQIMINHY